MSGWHLAAIKRADIDEILAIERQAFRHPWQRVHFENQLSDENACHYCVRVDSEAAAGPLIAYVFMRLFGSQLHLLKIAVTTALQRRGIGSRLLEQCFSRETQRGARAVLLEVRPSNIPAVGLYRKTGFEVIGKRHGYYGDSQEDALVMIKKLQEDT